MTTQYLTQEQQYLLEACLNDNQAEWQQLFAQARSAMKRANDPNSLEAQQIAWHCREKILNVIGGDRQLYESLINLYQQTSGKLESLDLTDADTLKYLFKAIAIFTLREAVMNVSFSNCTPETLEAIAAGQKAMRELHLNFIGTEGILLGLLAIESDPATQILNRAGINFEAVKHLLHEWLGAITVSIDEIPVEIPFTPRACHVLELAADRARHLNSPQIHPAHVLLGILDEGKQEEGIAMRALLLGYGVDLYSLEYQLMLLFREH
ncbi:MAG: Clp protease N-terminal domain-containing protein [Cyanobacteria bacterium J06627_8]